MCPEPVRSRQFLLVSHFRASGLERSNESARKLGPGPATFASPRAQWSFRRLGPVRAPFWRVRFSRFWVARPGTDCFTKRGPFVDTTVVARRAVTSGHALTVTVVDKCGQATKGAGWMSWHREATKDAVACDKPREAGKQALIRGFPNRETGLG
jgi:hypothetical protein